MAFASRDTVAANVFAKRDAGRKTKSSGKDASAALQVLVVTVYSASSDR